MELMIYMKRVANSDCWILFGILMTQKYKQNGQTKKKNIEETIIWIVPIFSNQHTAIHVSIYIEFLVRQKNI